MALNSPPCAAFEGALETGCASATSLDATGLYRPKNTLGVSYIRSEEFLSAIDLFERLAKGDPKDALALANLTVAYRRSGRMDQAQDAHRRLQALDISIAQRVFDEEFRSK